MLLDLCDQSQHRIDVIEVTDGCFPRISIDIGSAVGKTNLECQSSRPQTPNEEYYVTNLEPAVWSIILLLDKICVDCQRRRVTWTTKGINGSDGEHTGGDDSYEHYPQDECYDYNDDIDQLFDLSKELIKLSKSRRDSKKNQDDKNLIKEERYFLIRILYCYILPKVQLYKDDLPKVLSAIEKQTCCIDKINQDIERDSQTMDRLYQALQSQQDQWLADFENIARRNKSCTKEFLKTFQKHLEKRKELLDVQFEQKQDIVTHIKEDIEMNDTTPEKETALALAREERSLCHDTLRQVLVVSRDTIATALKEHEFLENDCEEIVENYLKTSDMLVKQKLSASRQMDKKVRATSIHENLRRIKGEIETNGEAGSIFLSNSGHRPTDVLPGMHVPEFQTLSERVSAIVKNSEHPLGMASQNFIAKIHEECEEIFDNIKTLQDNYVIVGHDGSLQPEYQSISQNLVHEIKEHFWIMASNFKQHFNATSNVIRNKLQLCYEEHFYAEVGKNITAVYRLLHEYHQQQMLGGLEVITELPINCLELGMKDEWWLQLFEKRRKLTSRSRSSSRCVEPPGNFRPDSSSSHSSTDSDPPRRTPQRQRPPSKMMKFINFMRRRARVVSATHGNGMAEESNDCNVSNGTDDFEWLPKRLSVSNGSPKDTSGAMYEQDVKKFDEYFGPSLEDLHRMFEVPSILAKLQCLTSSLRKVTNAVQELRRQVQKNSSADIEENTFSLAVSGDDLLPLIVLLILQTEWSDVSALQGHLKMIQDLIPHFLSAGCHGWAVMEFQMACQVLQNMCREFSWDGSFNHSSMSYRHE